MKILIICELPEFALDELHSLSSNVRYEPEMRPEELRDAIAGASVLVVGNQRVSPEVVERGDALQMIVRAGPGPGEIALAEASTHGIFVCHCPNQHAVAAAELALGLLLALDRQVVENAVALRESRWIRANLEEARGLAGRSLGILGYGSVGEQLAQRARAFGMRVLAWCQTVTPETPPAADVRFCNWPRELARESDFVVVCPLNTRIESSHLVDGEFLENMRDDARLVHIGSPGTIDEAALLEAIQERGLRVALDVPGPESTGDRGRFRCRLCELPGVIGTQNVRAHTEQARQATAAEVVRIVRAFLISGQALHCLNLLEHSPATWQLVLRVQDAVGVMAAILEVIRADGINAEEITSRLFLGGRAAWCTVALDERPSTDALEAIRALKNVLYLQVRAVV